MHSNQECMTCQWCCRTTVVKLESEEDAYLFWVQGKQVFQDVARDGWYWISDIPCQHITPYGCNIYNKRPKLCHEYDCGCVAPPGVQTDRMIASTNKYFKKRKS